MRCVDRWRRHHRIAAWQGLDVVVIDRELPGRGSTAASTSMLLWEIDRSLTELTEFYGFGVAGLSRQPEMPSPA
jgi:hypothetical protein